MAEVQTTFQDTTVNGKAVKIVSFVGQLDETNVDEEAKKMYQVIDGMEVPNLLLDFSELAYMNSKSIGYVTDWYSRVVAKNGKVVIAHPRPNILDILKVVGITQIIKIYGSLEEAKQAFSGAAPAEEAAPTPTAVSAEQPAAPAGAQPEAPPPTEPETPPAEESTPPPATPPATPTA